MAAVLRLLSRRGEPSLRVRRALVIVTMLVIPLTAVVTQTRELGINRDVSWMAYLFVLVVVGVPLLILGEFRRNVFRRGNADERERVRRDEAYRISYRIIEYAIPLGVLAGVVLAWGNPLPELWMALYFPIFTYVIILPYAVFAWREPDVVD